MKINSFEDILAWQKAEELTIEVYSLMRDSKDFGYKDQIQRASVSIMNNIAEGFERQSNKELRQFLYIAKGSCGEVRSMLRLSEKLSYTTPEESAKLINKAYEISRMISGLIKTL